MYNFAGMNYMREIEWYEILLIALIGMLYLIFVFRTIGKGKKLGTIPYFIVVKMVIRGIYLALIIISILGPSFGKTEKEMKAVAKDIYIAVDLSKSMNAADVQPSRLERAKFELKTIIKSFAGDMIGLVIFSSEAFVQCPITYDHAALNMFLETLSSDLVPNAGTDLARPLELALDKHTDEGDINSNAKIIILISDGEDFSEHALEVVEEIRDHGIKLFVLGIGSENGAKIPFRRGFKKDKSGNEVISKLNKSSLLKLASMTGGNYYEINPNRNETEILINAIKKIKGEERDAKKMDVNSNKFLLFLIPALMLICLDILFKINILKLN